MITVSPGVVAEVVAVASELAPDIVSLDVNDLELVETYCNGLATVISLPLAPLDPPVITSPLVNVPVIVPTVKVGATASVEVSCES